jgi:hypothetical protein
MNATDPGHRRERRARSIERTQSVEQLGASVVRHRHGNVGYGLRSENSALAVLRAP